MLEQEYVWSEYFDLYEEDKSHQEVAMLVLGREIKKIAKANDLLFQRLIRILHDAIEGRSRLMDHMIEDSEKETIEQKQKILCNIMQGMTGSITVEE